MKFRRAVASTAAAGVLIVPTGAHADGAYDVEPDLRHSGSASLTVEGRETSTEQLERVASSGGPQYVATPHGRWDDQLEENSGWCRGLRWQPVPEDGDEAAIRAHAEEQFEMLYTREASLRGIGLGQVDWNFPCPVDPADALPQEVVEAAVRDAAFAQLPRPQVSIPPDFGLAGLRMHLVTGNDHTLTYGPETFELDLDVLQLNVTFSATGSSRVDWGDGTVTSHEVAGAPYPDGQVTHVWTDVGSYDITVTDTWTVDYDAEIVSGQLTGTLDAVTLPGFEVTERRAVRTR